MDEGGVTKEFFLLITKQIMDVNYCMFEYVKDETILWFDKNPLECGLNFELVGMLLGLSIYNNVNLDNHFPIVVYKKLMNKTVGIKVNF